MAYYVIVVALVMSAASFIAYLIVAVAAHLKVGREAHAAATAALAARAEPAADLADLIKALGEFTDSLSKAGPALTSIVASIMFLAIAAYGSGMLTAGAAPAAKIEQPHASAKS